jgi:alcohol dehydrogenase class IV
MKNFNYYQPTEILFGCGRINQIGKTVAKYGKRCLLVTVDEEKAPPLVPLYDKVKASLKAAGVDVTHFTGVIPNPTTESVTAGADMAKEHKSDVVLGVGGGSSMDTAKAIAVEATHEGTCWDYLFYKEEDNPISAEKTLPVIAVSTTSGTGSQVTQVAVVTNPAQKDKSALYNPIIYPKVAVVDSELMLTLPEHITASTGFDAFCHSFEAYIHPNASSYIDLLAVESVRLVIENLPTAMKDGSNIEARSALAWADTLGGLCIANAGVTMPHGIGMAISGMYPHVAHGEALAINYPTFTRFTWKSAIRQFATLGRILDNSLESQPDEVAAEKSCELLDDFLKKIGMYLDLKGFDMPEGEIAELATASMRLPDYENNPKVATDAEMLDIIKESYSRG